MIRTVVKIVGFRYGGKAKLKLPSNFRGMRPDHRKSFLTQAMKDLRLEYDLACEHARIDAVHEDARNAEAATLRGAETATS
jgi:hypothetical protein